MNNSKKIKLEPVRNNFRTTHPLLKIGSGKFSFLVLTGKVNQ